MIIHGRLAPGTWMIEADIADRLSLSRTPVRGALHLLAREGYVMATGTGGKARMIVAPLTKEDAQELYAIIGHLEGLGARQTALMPAAARKPVIDCLQDLNRYLSEMAGARRPDATRIFETDLNFHRTVLKAAAGPRLLELHGRIQPQAERYWRLYAGAIVDELETSVAEHDAIIAALWRSDPDEAERRVQLNWSNGFERLSRVIDSLGERGSW
jgi:DNA-binding GntR family transcriptional regulator